MAWPVRVVAVESSGPGFNFARSVNVGLSRAAGDVLVLNDDARVAPGALDALLQARRTYGEGVYQCYIHGMNGSPWEIGWRYDPSFLGPIRYAISIRGPFATVRKLAKGELHAFLPLRFPRVGFDGFSFNAALVTAGVRQAVGPLDEGLPLGWEDIDYSLRCHERQVSYFAVPAAVVYHARTGTRKKGDPRERPSYAHLAEKWPKQRMVQTFRMGPKGSVAR
jgi:N-acetylglucosaminyl-diphospho-decaprenol L-rhamnosyltransferase